MNRTHEQLARVGQNSIGIRMGQEPPEGSPVGEYEHCGPYTHAQGKVFEPAGNPDPLRVRLLRTKRIEPDEVRSEPRGSHIPPPKNMGARIPWRVSDEEPDVKRETLNETQGRPKSAKFACTLTGCDWWATKESSTVKHRKKADHRVYKV